MILHICIMDSHRTSADFDTIQYEVIVLATNLETKDGLAIVPGGLVDTGGTG
jgi:hypothetical protein